MPESPAGLFQQDKRRILKKHFVRAHFLSLDKSHWSGLASYGIIFSMKRFILNVFKKMHLSNSSHQTCQKKSKASSGFTLSEIIIVIIILAVLLFLGVFYYFRVIVKSENTEALVNLKAIRVAEEVKKQESGTYVNATSTEGINSALSVIQIEDKIFRYKVVNATDDDFIAIAERIKGSPEKDVPIEIAMYSDGSVKYASRSGSGGYSYAGGGSYGGSGGSGGGGGGGGGGGSGGGGGGSSGGGSSGGGSGSGSSGGDSSDTPRHHSASASNYPIATTSEVLELLNGSTVGDYYYDLIKNEGIEVSYANLDTIVKSGTLGLYMPTWWEDVYGSVHSVEINSIYLNEKKKGLWSKEALACILVHEGMHADWDYNTDKWVAQAVSDLGVTSSELNWIYDPVLGHNVMQDSIYQEYQAFVVEALFWKEIKGTQKNSELDYVLGKYEEGPEYLYARIAEVYGADGYEPYGKGLNS